MKYFLDSFGCKLAWSPLVWNGNGTEKDPQFSALVLTLSF